MRERPGRTTAYGTSVGYLKLRAWIAEKHGVEPEHVIVTNGSMQADAFLFEQLVGAGDEVVVERPTYDRTLLSLRKRGARMHAVELEPDGIDTDALGRLLEGPTGAKPKLAHIIPNFQNPAGYTLSAAKRRALLWLAAEHGFVVFEDDPYVELRFSGEPLPTMLSMDPERVVYASSFSKTVCPGIRVGYLVGPRGADRQRSPSWRRTPTSRRAWSPRRSCTSSAPQARSSARSRPSRPRSPSAPARSRDALRTRAAGGRVRRRLKAATSCG